MADDDLQESRPDFPAEHFIMAGGTVDEAVVTLALYGEDLDPVQISHRLGCEPSASQVKGERGSPRSAPYRKGAWFLTRRGTSPRTPAELVREVIALVPNDPALWEELAKRFDVQVRFGIFQATWNRGFDLPTELVESVAKLHASLDFDLYMNPAYGDES